MRDRYRKLTAVLIILSGFFAGAALPELLRMGSGTYAGFLSVYSFQKYEGKAVSAAGILPYIAAGRLRTLLFLWMSSYTAAGLLFHLVYAWWLAASGGMLLALFMLRDGYEGILLFFCCLFPQWLLYGAVWQQEAACLVRRRDKGAQRTGGVSGTCREDLLELAGMAGLCLLGCAAEAFLGTWTLKIFLRFYT